MAKSNKNDRSGRRPKPDDRSDNVGKLQDTIHDTIENYREAEDYMKLHAEDLDKDDVSGIEEKNRNRLYSIRGMRDEIEDETEDRGNDDDDGRRDR